MQGESKVDTQQSNYILVHSYNDAINYHTIQDAAARLNDAIKAPTQVHAGQAVLLSHLLRAQVLLYSDRVVGTAFDSGVICYDHDFLSASHPTDNRGRGLLHTQTARITSPKQHDTTQVSGYSTTSHTRVHARFL